MYASCDSTQAPCIRNGNLGRKAWLSAFLSLATALLVSGTTLAQDGGGKPSVGSQFSYAGTGAGGWATPGNVPGPPDNNCANMGAVDRANLTYNYSFSLPNDAVITDVTAFTKAGEQSSQIIGIQLASDASVEPPALIGSQIMHTVTGGGTGACATTAVDATGGDLSFWGTNTTELNPAVVNTTQFGVVFTKLEQSSVKVDSVCLVLTYETVTGPAEQEDCFSEPPPETNNITVTKVVEGTAPGAPWEFEGTPDIGMFTLPAGGGQMTFMDLADDTYSIAETPKAGYTVTSECFIEDVSVSTGGASVDVDVAEGQSANCVFTNTLNTATFTVTKTYSDATTDPVTVELSCDSGMITPVDNMAAPGDPAEFTVSGYTPGDDCTAVENPVPTGFTWTNEADCQDVDIDDPGTCNINNELNTATFTVNKDFSDNNDAAVQITLSCSGTTSIDSANPAPATELVPATFEVSRFGESDTCTATEVVPQGYTADESDCQDEKDLADGGSCTIVNTANEGTFTVFKDFSDDSDAAVSVTASCSPGIVVNNPQPASEGNPAVFQVLRVTEGTTCTAVEQVPDGYEPDISDCQDNDPIDGDCTIVNQSTRTSFLVTKDFSDDNPAGVTVRIECNTGLPLQQDAVVYDPDSNPGPGQFTEIEFIVGDFEPGTLDCDIDEVIPAGYVPDYTASSGQDGVAGFIDDDEDGCHYEQVERGQFTCHIFNELQPVEVVVEKEWIDENPQFLLPTTVQVTLTCDGPIVSGYHCLNGDGTNGDYCKQKYIDPDNPGEFDVLPHFEGTTCRATEEPQVGVLTDESDCEEMIVFPGQGASCVIVNTRLYAGIPTLNQYGLMLLALLMLSVGAIAYRRFA